MSRSLLLTRLRGATEDGRRDEGAFAILFAVLVVVLVGVVGFALDLALLRESRAQTRSMADSAVVVAGAALKDQSGAWTPGAACTAGWSYLVAGIGADGSSSCSSFTDPYTVCPATPITATWTDAEWRVVWTWPVPQDSTLMTRPDSEREQSQVYNAQVDGASACDRIAVEIYKLSQLGLSSVFGQGESTTRSASVARNVQTGTDSSAIAALNILDTANCKALATDGQGKVTVGTATRAGIIAVESDASARGGSLGCGTNYALDPGQGSKPGDQPWVKTVGPAAGGGKGIILSFALSGVNSSRAYPGAPGSPTDPSTLNTTPTSLSTRSGTAPVTAIFQSAISSLRSSLGGSTAPSGFTTLPGPAVPTFSCNRTGAAKPLVIPRGDYWINCATYNVKDIVIFTGGRVVAKGDIDIQGGACLAINVPATSAAACPTITGLGTNAVSTSPAPSADSLLYLQNGRLYRTSTGVFLAPRTMTFVSAGSGGKAGQIDVGGGDGQLLMTSPADPSGSFYKLTVWSDSTAVHTIGGQGALGLRGVFFIPFAPTELTGQASGTQTSAQFWTLRLTIKGQGEIVMDVDPNAAIPRPIYGSTLIR